MSHQPTQRPPESAHYPAQHAPSSVASSAASAPNQTNNMANRPGMHPLPGYYPPYYPPYPYPPVYSQDPMHSHHTGQMPHPYGYPVGNTNTGYAVAQSGPSSYHSHTTSETSVNSAFLASLPSIPPRPHAPVSQPARPMSEVGGYSSFEGYNAVPATAPAGNAVYPPLTAAAHPPHLGGQMPPPTSMHVGANDAPYPGLPPRREPPRRANTVGGEAAAVTGSYDRPGRSAMSAVDVGPARPPSFATTTTTTTTTTATATTTATNVMPTSVEGSSTQGEENASLYSASTSSSTTSTSQNPLGSISLESIDKQLLGRKSDLRKRVLSLDKLDQYTYSEQTVMADGSTAENAPIVERRASINHMDPTEEMTAPLPRPDSNRASVVYPITSNLNRISLASPVPNPNQRMLYAEAGPGTSLSPDNVQKRYQDTSESGAASGTADGGGDIQGTLEVFEGPTVDALLMAKPTSRNGKFRVSIRFDRAFYNAGGYVSGQMEVVCTSSTVRIGEISIEVIGIEGKFCVCGC
jgi:hypothetical protein